MNSGSLGQGAAPCAGQPWAQLFWPVRGHQPCLGTCLPLTTVPRSWPRVATHGEDGSGRSGSQWVSFAIPHPSARWLKPALSRLLVPGTSQQAAEQKLSGSQSARGWPWAGRAVTCPGADPGPVACPDLHPAGSCSWEMAAVLLDGAGPSQHQGMEAHTGIQLGLHLQGLGRQECVDPSWFAEGLLTPSLVFSACQGATGLPRRLHPLASFWALFFTPTGTLVLCFP